MTIKPFSAVQQDPTEAIIRQFDWTDWLREISTTAEVATSTFTVSDADDAALTVDQDSIVTGGLKTQFRVNGGTPGQTYKVTNTIVTNESPAQTGVRYFWVQVPRVH